MNPAPHAAVVAEVDVNPRNGNVRVTRVGIGHDSAIGRVLPPLPYST